MAQLNEFSTLTLDCYGTLIDWERGILTEIRPWLACQGRSDLDDNAILEAFGTAETACEAKNPHTLYPQILEATHRRLADLWDVKSTDEDAVAFGQSVGRWPVFVDTASSLQYLKRYYKLVILSNVDRASFAASNEKLGVVFDRILTAEDIGSYKPDIRNFAFAMTDLERYFNIPKKQVLHTAQSIFHDIIPAKSIGLATLWVNRRRDIGGWGATPAPGVEPQDARPDFEVANLADLVALHQRHLRGEIDLLDGTGRAKR